MNFSLSVIYPRGLTDPACRYGDSRTWSFSLSAKKYLKEKLSTHGGDFLGLENDLSWVEERKGSAVFPSVLVAFLRRAPRPRCRHLVAPESVFCPFARPSAMAPRGACRQQNAESPHTLHGQQRDLHIPRF